MSNQSEYIETATWHAALCLQWQATDASENGGEGYPISDGGDEYTADVADLAELRQSVSDFVRSTWQTLQTAGVSAEDCGHNLILTANGHGTGFWDRGLGAAGNVLTYAARPYSFDAEFMLWGDDADGEEHLSDEVRYLECLNTLIYGEYPE
jgi:hypothetical protein